MAGFDVFKRKALDAAGTIADKSIELYKAAEIKTKELAKATKLSAEIAKEKSNVKKLYAELGGLYYQLYKNDPDESLAQICAEITSSLDLIEAKEAELDDLHDDGCDCSDCTDADVVDIPSDDTEGGGADDTKQE